MKFHIVQVNEKIKDISKKYSVSVDEIIKLNRHINNIDNIVPGMKLRLPILSEEVSDQLKDNFLDIEKYYPKLEDFKEAKVEKKVVEDYQEEDYGDDYSIEGPQINVIPQNDSLHNNQSNKLNPIAPQAYQQPAYNYQYPYQQQGYPQTQTYQQPNYPQQGVQQQQQIYQPPMYPQPEQTQQPTYPQQGYPQTQPYQQQNLPSQPYQSYPYNPIPFLRQNEGENKQENTTTGFNVQQPIKPIPIAEQPLKSTPPIQEQPKAVEPNIGFENYSTTYQPYYPSIQSQVAPSKKLSVDLKQKDDVVYELDEKVKEIKVDLRDVVKHTKIRRKVKDPLDLL